jgi:hypothetical protein
MRYKNLAAFIEAGRDILAKGPIAIVMAEDQVEIESTVLHHLNIGFRAVILLANREIALSQTVEDQVHRVDYETHVPEAIQTAVNQVIEAAVGTWMYYGFNAEYLFHPFCETRNVRDLLAFQTEERRDALLSYVIDLYADDLIAHPLAVSLDTAMLDRSGYYALGRPDPANHNHPRERQLDFFGGLRWRFEEHIPAARRKIDRIALFRAKPGLKLRADYTFSDEEYK